MQVKNCFPFSVLFLLYLNVVSGRMSEATDKTKDKRCWLSADQDSASFAITFSVRAEWPQTSPNIKKLATLKYPAVQKHLSWSSQYRLPSVESPTLQASLLFTENTLITQADGNHGGLAPVGSLQNQPLFQ